MQAFDAAWKQISWTNIDLRPSADWQPFSQKASLPNNAAHMIFYFWVKGEGQAWLDEVTMLNAQEAMLTAQQRGPVQPGPVSNLRVTHRRGQSFLTFSEIPGKGVTYNVYRSRARITDTTKLTPIATLPQGTAKLKYTGKNLVVTDRGDPLPDNTGLLV